MTPSEMIDVINSVIEKITDNPNILDTGSLARDDSICQDYPVDVFSENKTCKFCILGLFAREMYCKPVVSEIALNNQEDVFGSDQHSVIYNLFRSNDLVIKFSEFLFDSGLLNSSILRAYGARRDVDKVESIYYWFDSSINGDPTETIKTLESFKQSLLSV